MIDFVLNGYFNDFMWNMHIYLLWHMKTIVSACRNFLGLFYFQWGVKIIVMYFPFLAQQYLFYHFRSNFYMYLTIYCITSQKSSYLVCKHNIILTILFACSVRTSWSISRTACTECRLPCYISFSLLEGSQKSNPHKANFDLNISHSSIFNTDI